MYNPLDELLNYYYFIFIGHLMLTLIIVINSFKQMVKHQRGDFTVDFRDSLDMIISILAGIGLLAAMFFHGVISDISGDYDGLYNNLLILSGIGFLFFIVQSICFMKADSLERENN